MAGVGQGKTSDPMRTALRCILLALLALILPAAGQAKEKAPQAEIRIQGLGFLNDRSTSASVKRLWGEKPPAELSTNQIEDAALFIASNLTQEGFQRPTISVEAHLIDGTTRRFNVDPTLQTLPPPNLRAQIVHFKVDRGVRSYLKDLSIEGLHKLKEKDGREFFFSEVTLFEGRAARAYSPARLRRSADALEETLRQRGYVDAKVTILEVHEVEKTGEVSAKIKVEEGSLWQLAKLEVECRGPESPELNALRRRTGVAWSNYRTQDLAEEIRRTYFKNGYADVRVRVEVKPGEIHAGVRPVDVIAHVRPGEQSAVGQVKFAGHFRARESVLHRRVEVSTGDPLNPVELEKARYRLGHLGIFHSVDLKYDPPTGPVRDPIYVLQEERPFDANLMIGYGSYEQLRGGVELLQRDLFGRGHQSRLELVQSFKSSSGDYTYTVPEIFGESVDGSARLFGLDRKERSFLREEYGGTLTLKRKFGGVGADGAIGYTYQSLRNAENELYTSASDNRQLTVASIDLSFSKDERDNPLRPRRGYRWFAQAELAAHELGSEVNYQRVELGGNYHTAWGRGRWIHLGFTHGFVTTLGSNDQSLPVNRRFYPGGEDSIRGYTEGGAAPRGPDGRFIGAKTYTLLNVEVEQALAGNWSAVVFTDALGVAAKISSYPFDTELVTLGLGLRYNTLIGPVRLEYGHNVKRRAADPHGTIQFSIGFPF
jgi:outer membrane protein insertion porin family